MSRLGMFACLLMLVAVAICVEMPPNTKAPELPKEGARPGPLIPPRPEGPRPDGPRVDGKPDLPKGESPKPDAKGPPDAKS